MAGSIIRRNLTTPGSTNTTSNLSFLPLLPAATGTGGGSRGNSGWLLKIRGLSIQQSERTCDRSEHHSGQSQITCIWAKSAFIRRMPSADTLVARTSIICKLGKFRPRCRRVKSVTSVLVRISTSRCGAFSPGM